MDTMKDLTHDERAFEPAPAKDRHLIRSMNLLKIGLAALIVCLGLWWQTGSANATTVQIRIYSSLEPSSDLQDSGLHFDEGNVAFGARDWIFYGAGSSTHVYLRLNLYQTQIYFVRYHVYPIGSDCTMGAKLAQYINGSWVDIGGTEIHFEHQTQIAETWTAYAINAGEAIALDLGNLKWCGDLDGYHSHQSADVGTTGLMTAVPQTNETCWTDLEYSFQCPGSFPDHYTCSSSSGTASVSGSITEYKCSTWSVYARSTTYPAFYVWY